MTRVVRGSRRLVRTGCLFVAVFVWVVWIAAMVGLGVVLPVWVGWVAYAVAGVSLVAVVGYGIGWVSAAMVVDDVRQVARWWPNRVVVEKADVVRFVSELRLDPRLSNALWLTFGRGAQLYYVVAERRDGSRLPIMSSFAPRRLSERQRDELNAWLQS